MNAMYRAPAYITNKSYIVFADKSRGYNRIKTLTKLNQMMCSVMGNFFVSEGRQGDVLRVRAKSTKFPRFSIIRIMQSVLHNHFRLEKKCDVGNKQSSLVYSIKQIDKMMVG